MAIIDRSTQFSEVEDNYSYYRRILPDIETVNHGKYALLRHQSVIDFYTSIVEAQASAQKLYSDGIYSIQKVAQAPVELGFYSYADSKRTA